jgi:hypothetical protein
MYAMGCHYWCVWVGRMGGMVGIGKDQVADHSCMVGCGMGVVVGDGLLGIY